MSATTIDNLRETISELRGTVSDLKATVKTLEKALLDKGVENDKVRKALKNVSGLMEKHSERQDLEPKAPDPEFTPKEAKPKYDPQARGNNGAKKLERMECEERIIMVEPDSADMEGARFIRYQDSIRYKVIPAKVIKEIYRCAVYTRDGSIVRGKAPMAPLQNSSFDGSFIAFCTELHFVYAMPYSRIASYLEAGGFKIGRGTITGLVKKACKTFERLHQGIRQAILTDPYISGDETYSKVRIHRDATHERGIKKGYIWDLVAHHLKLAYFNYSEGSRKESVFEVMIEGYMGTFQSDALPTYRKLGAGKYEGITRIPCLQHIKRKFLELEKIPEAAGIVRLFNLLYDREHLHKTGVNGWTEEDNLKWRREYAPPILERIKKELDRLRADPKIPPGSSFAEAVTYALNEWEWVPGIFEGGGYDLDNNTIERMQRLVSILRRNSLFFGSHEGGKTAAVYLSIVASCKLNGIKPMDYISDILNRCAAWPPTTPVEKYRDLLPDRWQPSITV